MNPKQATIMVTLALSLWATLSKAQLTNGEIFDFSVGDTIQAKYNYHDPVSARDSINTMVILAKQYGAAMDTVYYTVHKISDISGYYMATAFSSHVDTVMQLICSDPDSVPAGCAMLTNSCGDSTWGCPPAWISGSIFSGFTFVKSWGGRYFTYSNDATVFSSNTLVYHSRAGVSCGTFMVGLSETAAQAFQFRSYPNPTSGPLQIEEGIVLKAVSVYDCLARQVLHVEGDRHSIDLSSFENGVYTLCIQSSDGQCYSRKVLLNK